VRNGRDDDRDPEAEPDHGRRDPRALGPAGEPLGRDLSPEPEQPRQHAVQCPAHPAHQRDDEDRARQELRGRDVELRGPNDDRLRAP